MINADHVINSFIKLALSAICETGHSIETTALPRRISIFTTDSFTGESTRSGICTGRNNGLLSLAFQCGDFTLGSVDFSRSRTQR